MHKAESTRMKKLLLYLHLYIGLMAALFLIAISVSGAIIAFEPELNRAFHPELTNVTPVGAPLNWDAFRARVEQQTPGWKLIRFYFPERPDLSTYVRLRNATTHKIRHVYVNQYRLAGAEAGNGGRQQLDPEGTRSARKLSLRQGRQPDRDVEHGGSAVAVADRDRAVVAAASGLSAFIGRPCMPQSLNRDLHLSLGFWSSVAMFGFAVTGLGLHYQTGKLLDLLNTPQNAVSIAGHGATIEGMLQTAREALPGAAIPRLLLPEKKGDPVFLYMRFPEDKTPAGRSFVTLDPKTGAVLSMGSSRNASVMETALVQWTREVHTRTLLWPSDEDSGRGARADAAGAGVYRTDDLS